ncbi:MAG: hypothetical protein QHH80_05770 [Anaerolineae bacterium]|nr:hypothetical protein [Anaerolineae bacterium]
MPRRHVLAAMIIVAAVMLGACGRATTPTPPPTPSPAASPTPALTATPDPNRPDAVEIALAAILARHRVGWDQVRVLSWEAVDWPDGCLGIRMEGMCTEAIVPGYRLVLEIGGEVYEYRTDRAGGRVLMAAGPLHGVDEPALAMEVRDEGGCRLFLVAADGRVAYGPCGAPLTPLRLVHEMGRPEQLTDLLARFAPFEAQAADAKLVLVGQGAEQPSLAWQRAMMAWARVAMQEVEYGRGGASWDLAVRWQQAIPDRAGYCRFLQVDACGYAFASTARCDGGDAAEAGRGWLTTAELERLDGWLYALGTAETDALVFSGRGAAPMTDADRAAVEAWAAAVYERLSVARR